MSDRASSTLAIRSEDKLPFTASQKSLLVSSLALLFVHDDNALRVAMAFAGVTSFGYAIYALPSMMRTLGTVSRAKRF